MSDEKDPFEEALAAIHQEETSGEGGNAAPQKGNEEQEDPFESALTAAKQEIGQDISVTEPVDVNTTVDLSGINLDFLMEVKLKVSFEVGRTKMIISDLLSLGQGSVIELHRLVGENLDVLVNGHLLATGKVVVVNEKFGAQIVDIISPEERIKKMGGAFF